MTDERFEARLRFDLLQIIRETRDETIAATIDIVREFVKSGECSERCAEALESLRARLPRPPSAAN